jgi:hypothetical protein
MTHDELLSPIKFVVDNSQYVSIDRRAITQFARGFDLRQIDVAPKSWPFKMMKFETIEDEIDFWFLADAMAFCFWGYPKKWSIEYQSKRLDGWWALLAAFQKALEQGTPLLEGKYLATLSDREARRIFDGQPEIPLLKERIVILRGIGSALLKHKFGRFYQFLTKAPHEALPLMLSLAETFPGFDDWAEYKGRRIYFYKKAQLLVADINRLINIEGGELLIGEADYKIPALLRGRGILKYTKKLAELVDNRAEIPSGSEMEVEIRANMLWAIQLILPLLKPRDPTLTASNLDRYLWHLSQNKKLILQPYHLTKTINY